MASLIVRGKGKACASGQDEICCVEGNGAISLHVYPAPQIDCRTLCISWNYSMLERNGELGTSGPEVLSRMLSCLHCTAPVGTISAYLCLIRKS
jgi:hypothetical protein